MTFPLLLQFLSTTYKWFRLEKRESKRWSWIILLLQCWPQWRAIRIIQLEMKKDEEAQAKKIELMREVTTTEPFLEAWPSILVMTIICFISIIDDSFWDYCGKNNLILLLFRDELSQRPYGNTIKMVCQYRVYKQEIISAING